MSSLDPLHALNLDVSAQQSFIRYFRQLPDKPSTTIRIFNRVDYYTCHGEDAVLASQDVFQSTAVLKRMGADEQKLEYIVLSKNNFEKFARSLLLVQQYQVEVYVNQGSTKNNDWVLEFKGSPGNLSQFEEILFENIDNVTNTIVMGVKMGPKQVLGVSCVDVNARSINICEFTDNEFFSQLESLIIQTGPREVLLQLSDSENTVRLKTILFRSNILCTTQKQKEFNSANLTQDLDRLLHFDEGQQRSCLSLPEINLTVAMSSLHSIITYLELMSDDTFFDKFTMSILDTKRFVHLDMAAVKALNIVPKPGVSAGVAKISSLLGLLDDCRTSPGKRMLAQWIKQPLRDLNTLTDRLDVVQVFVENTSLRLMLHGDYLRRIPDLLMLSRKLQKKRCKLQDIYKIYQTVDKLPHMVAELRNMNHKTLQSMFVNQLSEFLEDMQKFQRMVETTLDMDLVDKGEYFVKSSFDDDLTDLYEKKVRLEEQIQKQLNVASRDLGLDAGKTIKLEFADQQGYFLRVTLKEEPILRRNKQYKIISTLRGGVRFVNTKLEDLNIDYLETKQQYEEQQKTVVTEILNIALGYADTLNSISFCIAQLDVLVSFANVTCSAPKQFVRPILRKEGTGYMKLSQVRHPCLEIQDGMSFTPNDIEFKRGESQFHIITGPNMGGKSTYIRSVGVAVLMAHIGCFVPCDSAELSMVDSILARVGSEDCQSKGLSTFMVEMVETAGIIRTATQNSLVIIDELGRGTSTYEGCGIAWAIAEHLATEINCFSMFATHFHEITKLADDIPTVANRHVNAMITGDSLTLLHQVKPGICGQSYGIHVAKMAGFNSEFLEIARKIQNDLEDYRSLETMVGFAPETRQKILQEGDTIIAEVLEELEKLNYKRMNSEELEVNVKRLKTEIKDKNNLYLNALLLG